MSLNLSPAWIEDLLCIWSSSDLAVEKRALSYASVSPMFARLGVADDDIEQDVGGYSLLEVFAMRKALETLQAEDELGWQAVLHAFRPWALGPPGAADHMERLRRAAARLAELVDKEMGS